MWLQLGNQEFRQVLMTGVVRRLVPRVPNFEGGPTQNSWEEAYVKCTWRSEDHTLLDFLRLSNKHGQRRKNSRRVCVSAVMGPRLRDEFYGKWLLLNVPFRGYAELWDDRAALVPEGYRLLTLCLLKRPGFFRVKEVREAMQLEGYREVHIDNVLAMLEGHRAIIDGYLSGEWTLEAQPQPPALAAPLMAGHPPHLFNLGCPSINKNLCSVFFAPYVEDIQFRNNYEQKPVENPC